MSNHEVFHLLLLVQSLQFIEIWLSPTFETRYFLSPSAKLCANCCKEEPVVTTCGFWTHTHNRCGLTKNNPQVTRDQPYWWPLPITTVFFSVSGAVSGVQWYKISSKLFILNWGCWRHGWGSKNPGNGTPRSLALSVGWGAILPQHFYLLTHIVTWFDENKPVISPNWPNRTMHTNGALVY
jgi:hypothetical protein